MAAAQNHCLGAALVDGPAEDATGDYLQHGARRGAIDDGGGEDVEASNHDAAEKDRHDERPKGIGADQRWHEASPGLSIARRIGRSI
jgi:hypothetical protein